MIRICLKFPLIYTKKLKIIFLYSYHVNFFYLFYNNKEDCNHFEILAINYIRYVINTHAIHNLINIILKFS